MVSNTREPGGQNLKTIKNFGLQVLTGRWFMVFASLLIMSMSGATYMFGLYSGDIKSSQGYDQTTLNLLSFFKDLGGNVGILSGLINEISPPWVVLSLGAVMNLFGYLMIWLATSGHISKPPVWQMCAYICIGANSQTFANTGALVTCVKNFPESRGVVIGLLKGFVGLSGSIIAQLYRAFYGHDTKGLVLLIGWLPSVVSIIFLRTVRILKAIRQENELKVFYKLLFMALGLASFLMVMIILQNILGFSRLEYIASASLVVILLICPLAIVVNEDFHLWKRKNEVVVEPESSIHHPRVSPRVTQRTPDSCFSNVFTPPERGEDYTILQALLSIDMLILFTVTIFGVGGTLTAIDNLGQIGKSLGYPSKSITTFISLVSIWNFLGRVSSGFISEIVLAKYKFPRPLMLTIVLLISCSGHLLIAFGIKNSLYLASIIVGFCFGAQWPMIFAIISELFGLKYYSTLLNAGGAASPIGAYILNVRVAGYLYDREALKQMEVKGLVRKEGEDLSCIGVECYKLAFLIMTGGTIFAFLVSLVLVVRTRKFYKGDIYKKFKEQDGDVESEITMVKSNLSPSNYSPPAKVDK